jgi:ribosome-associated translation inhibitor RaiA
MSANNFISSGGSMFKIVFKNMKSSTLISANLHNRLGPVLEKYPYLKRHRVTVTIEMENSPLHAGPDFYSISVMLTGKTFKDLRMKKSSDNIYLVVSDLTEGLTGYLSRTHERLFKNSRKTIKFREAV